MAAQAAKRPGDTKGETGTAPTKGSTMESPLRQLWRSDPAAGGGLEEGMEGAASKSQEDLCGRGVFTGLRKGLLVEESLSLLPEENEWPDLRATS